MKRKLFSAALSAFALLLLMGAADVPTQAATLLAEEESAVPMGAALETEARSINTRFAQAMLAASGVDPLTVAESLTEEAPVEPEVPAEPVKPVEPEIPAQPEAPAEPVKPVDWSLLIDGQPTPLELGKRNVNGSTYVSLAVIAKELDPAAQVIGDGQTVTVTTGKLSLTAKAGQLYMVANGRYLYVPETVQLSGGQLYVPLRTVAKAFGAAVYYNKDTGLIAVLRGSGAIQSGDSFYNQDDLFWLSRVIYRESGNQSLEGQMAVGNVVLNRVADPAFPNTVEGVLAQKNQFSTYKSGALRKTTPSATSIIAAKLVLDGGVVEETRGALFFDSGTNSWAARNKKLIATFGDHNFYG